jgi:hypothetical protein
MARGPVAIASAWAWILLVVSPQQRRRNAGPAGRLGYFLPNSPRKDGNRPIVVLHTKRSVGE